MPIGKIAEFPFQNSSGGSAASVSTDQIVILADYGGATIGSGQLFSASIRPLRVNAQEFSRQSRSVEIPLVGDDGVVTGVLCRDVPSAAARQSPGHTRAGAWQQDRVSLKDKD
jgi:hypothetical protein